MKARSRVLQSLLAKEITRLVEHKRALGRRYETEERVLRSLDRFLAERGVRSFTDLNHAVLDAFMAKASNRRARSYNQLLGVVRRLFDWLVLQDILPRSPLTIRPRRRNAPRVPFIFAPTDARRLLDVAATLQDRPRAPLRGPTYRMIFALLYGLGLRVGEVCRLRRSDVDLDTSVLMVRNTKFGKNRVVPFGPRIAHALLEFLAIRAPRGMEPTAPFFSFTSRGHINPSTVSLTLRKLVPRLALTIPTGGPSPRVHDLRHSFAVTALLRWYKDGVDPASRLFHLSTFLGHVSPSSTATYLTITDELLREAAGRFHRFASDLLPGDVAWRS